jgi:hypothetical protein
MKKVVRLSGLIAIFALVVLLVIGSVGAAEIEPEGEIEVEPGSEGEVEAEESAPAEAKPSGTATRIDFEVSGDVTKEGLYVVQEVLAGEVASWYAMEGWQDSGWMEFLNISADDVWVQVLYYPGPDTEPTVLEILNHVPGKAYGWLSKGEAHALEVGWPDSE